MKKIIVILLVLILAVGCSSSNNLDKYGELNIDKKLNKLNYKLSSSWKIDSEGDAIAALINQDSKDFGLVVGCMEDDSVKAITSRNYDEDKDKLFEYLKNIVSSESTGAEIETYKINSKYALMFDFFNDDDSFRGTILFDDGCVYLALFASTDRDMSADELQYAYDYLKSLKIDK